MAYKFTINMENYNDYIYSTKDVQLSNMTSEGVCDRMNCYIHAINGLSYREVNLIDLRRRILFFGESMGNHGVISNEDFRWLDKWEKKNKVQFFRHKQSLRDGLRDDWVTTTVTAWRPHGICFDMEDTILELRKNGSVIIPFNYFYEKKFRNKGFISAFKNCFIKIEKC